MQDCVLACLLNNIITYYFCALLCVIIHVNFMPDGVDLFHYLIFYCLSLLVLCIPGIKTEAS